MKTYKSIIIGALALMFTLPTLAQTVDKEALYVYQNDGTTNIFFRNEVTGMSIETKDGVHCQVIKTGARQHAFPISKIQSIGFVNPDEDTYKPSIIVDDDAPTFGKFVDLGLPSGTMWASFNVGASTPEEYGGYFAWGETEEKETYTWENYIHCDGTHETCHDLGSDISGTEYDVAHVKWGGKWCLPTSDEIKELLDYCTSEWMMLNGVNGRKFTSKKNGNSIFLPAAGNWWYDCRYIDSWGEYWSSTQYSLDLFSAYHLSFSLDFCKRYDQNREFGISVRPVCHGLPISTHEIELIVGRSKTVDIISGSGNYTIESSDPEVAMATINENAIVINALNVGEATVTITDTQLGLTAYITAKVSSGVLGDVEAIDLGLPSSTKWASCNVGATKPEEFGDYYDWGETKEKIDYGENVFSLDDISGTEYDVAYEKWGGNWVMPTLDDIKELLDNCTSEWTTLNDVNGMKFTSNINGNSIFLPAAGRRWDTSSVSNVGVFGYYWSSTLNPSSNAYYLYFRSDYVHWNGLMNQIGQSVRPVWK